MKIVQHKILKKKTLMGEKRDKNSERHVKDM